MDLPSSPKARLNLHVPEARPIAAEDGVLMMDMSFRLIASDRGAGAILTDINRRNGSAESLPLELIEALRGTDLQHLSRFRIRLHGERQVYGCRAFLLESRLRTFTNPMISVYFQKVSSPGDAIRKVSIECGLTPREEEILAGVSVGLTSKELAERLKISPNTVKAFVRLIMIKMGVTTRSGIVGKLLAYGNGENSDGR
ncbi:MAG TPA: helix-turn-helix transcriptional regulator [Bryobacteraceae bacterium]|nr:helix-turn-helix transcriptional regulator [Bryobacteraceae bacterium]